MDYVVGARGRLGTALVKAYGNTAVPLERTVYASWTKAGAADEVSYYFERNFHENSVVFVASALLNPKLDIDDLLGVNFYLPQNVIEGATKLGLRVVVFGTALEGLFFSHNPYFRSKTVLHNYVSEVVAAGYPVTHIQLHNLFGIGLPSPFMFLGLILSSILNNSVFKMTSGRQLREYHHIDDVVRGIQILVDTNVFGNFILGSRDPVSLESIARRVFSYIGKEHLLRVGALPEPQGENFSLVLPPTCEVPCSVFRSVFPAILHYMKNCAESEGTKNA